MKLTTFKINPPSLEGERHIPQWFLTLEYQRKNVQVDMAFSTPRVNDLKYWLLIPTIAFQKEYSYPGTPLRAWYLELKWLNMTLFRFECASGYKPDKDPDSDQ